MNVRLNFIVEGQTEETFVNRVLTPHLASYCVFGNVRCVMTSRKRGAKYRGGLSTFALAKKDISLWMKEDQNTDAFFTTMFDLYALPNDFPCFEKATREADPILRAKFLEKALWDESK